MQSSTNQRTDQYGGSPESRVRFLEEIVQAIVDSGAFPANRIGVRLSPNGKSRDVMMNKAYREYLRTSNLIVAACRMDRRHWKGALEA